MARRNKYINGLDFQKKHICIAQYHPEENAVVSIIIKPIEEVSDDWWENVRIDFKKLVVDLKFAGQDVYCALPSDYAVIKRISLDKDESAVEDALLWDFGQNVVGAAEEYVSDYQPIPQYTTDTTKEFLFVGCRHESVKKLTGVLRVNRCNPLLLDVDILSLINVYEANYRDRLDLPAVIVQASEESSRLILTQGGTLVGFSTMDHRGEALTPGIYIPQLQEALTQACANHPDFNSSLREIFLAGALFLQPDFATRIGEAVSGVQILNPFKSVACRVEMSEVDLNRYAPNIAAAVGLALRGNELRNS